MKSAFVFCFFVAASAQAQSQGGKEMPKAEDIIAKLGLQPLPGEGGYFKETYKNDGSAGFEIAATTATVPSTPRPPVRPIATAIYYMVTPKDFSALHRLKNDEIFHFYSGDPVEMIQIDERGRLKRITIGSDILNGQEPQVVVKAGTWQASRLRAGGKWALMGTTMAPGFMYEEFELGDQAELLKDFPQHREDILQFSRAPGEQAHK